MMMMMVVVVVSNNKCAPITLGYGPPLQTAGSTDTWRNGDDWLAACRGQDTMRRPRRTAVACSQALVVLRGMGRGRRQAYHDCVRDAVQSY